MRKILLVALLVLFPLSVYALEPMSTDSLDEITAQEGVRISIGGGEAAPLIITQQSVSTAWENDNGATDGKSSVLLNVTGGTDTIKIWGDLTIEAKKATVGSASVDAVVIGLPQVTKEVEVPKSTVISIGGAVVKETDGSLSNGGAVLGTLYQTGGLTTVNTHADSNGTITITAM